jgi:hypothetical protein
MSGVAIQFRQGNKDNSQTQIVVVHMYRQPIAV